MSLESQIGSLVEAANNLTGTVAGKMQEIDQRVDQAVGSIPAAMRDTADQVFYIDPDRGDDSNSGVNGSNAFKTIGAVSQHIVPGSSVRIFLRNGHTYEEEGRFLSGINNAISLRAWNLGDERPVIKWQPEYHASSGTNRRSGISLTTGNVSIVQVDLEISNKDNGAEAVSQTSFVQCNLGKLDLFIRESSVSLSDMPLATGYAGYDSIDLHFNISSVRVDKNDNGRAVLFYNRSGQSSGHQLRLSAHSLHISGGLSLRDLLPINEAGTNILTNLEIEPITEGS